MCRLHLLQLTAMGLIIGGTIGCLHTIGCLEKPSIIGSKEIPLLSGSCHPASEILHLCGSGFVARNTLPVVGGPRKRSKEERIRPACGRSRPGSRGLHPVGALASPH